MNWKLACILTIATSYSAAAAPVQLHKGDHICIIGNTLADRMQHDGWLETFIQLRFPQHELVIRNLGFSGDELNLRLRSAGFGTPDEHLARQHANVIFAFFGYNESFRGLAGIAGFKSELGDFIKHTLDQKYNRRSPPSLIVFSPIALENLHDRNLPDGAKNNENIKLYTDAMTEVCRIKNVQFVDLFRPTTELYQRLSAPLTGDGGHLHNRPSASLTINGVHLDDNGNRMLGQIIVNSLFGDEHKTYDLDPLSDVSRAVLAKNNIWFNRYRTVDGYSIFGGRADLKFVNGQTNRVVMDRELEVLDIMTANRDKAIWAAAQGKHLEVKDDNLPPFIPVKTNFPGQGPGGTHLFLGAEEAIGKMQVAKGMKINLFASEEMFPELTKPVQMSFDAKGRLWVAVWPTYPHWKPTEERNDKILILEDTKGDGRADKCTVFADHLHCPTGFEFYNGGVLVAQAPDLMFLMDTSGGDKANFRQRMLSGLDSADTHHTANSFTLDPGGALYFQEGTFHHTQVETPYGPPVRCANAGVYRYEPRTQKFDTYVSYGFANPHGHVFDYWGQDIVTDGTSNVNYYAPAFSGHVDFPRKHPGMDSIFKERTRPCPGTEILSSRHFPDEMQGNFLDANVIGFQGILQYNLREKDSGFTANEVEPIVFSSDPHFRPSALQIGPDGAIYFLDWQNPIIGHMQHNLRDPSRDRTHGRIYRVTYPSRPLLKPPVIAGQPTNKLLDLLKEPENRVRYRAKIELGARDSDDVIAATAKWIESLDKSDPQYEHHLMEALWVHQYHNVVNEGLLRRMLRSPDYHARAAATRVLRYWRDRIPDVMDLLQAQVRDEHPRVRLMAIVALSDFRSLRAAEIALDVLKQPMDYYLRYSSKETIDTLEPYWKPVIAASKPFAADNPAAIKYLLTNISTSDLVKLAPSISVYMALLSREGVPHDYRHQALEGLAKLKKTDEASELLAAIQRADGDDSSQAMTVLHDLAHMLLDHAACDLEERRPQLVELTRKAHLPYTRQIAFAAVVLGDNKSDEIWSQASHSEAALCDLLGAIPALPNAKLRAAFYPRLISLLDSKNPAQARRAAMNAISFIEGREAESFETLSGLIQRGDEREEAIRALRRIPKSKWMASRIRPLVGAVIEHLSRLPASDRTKPAMLEELQLGNELATLLPPKEAKQVRSKLGDLGVTVAIIHTVPHKMIYDRSKFYVEADKPVVVLLENDDIMPHNMLIAAPGALAEIGMAAERMATRADGIAKHFIPNNPKVLQSTRMLQPREAFRLEFVAPSKPGDYPYVCTFPGHWRLMNGIMRVVPKLADVPPAELESPIESSTVAARPFVRNWTMDDLLPMLDQVSQGRSFENGKQIFTAASCVQCHTAGKDGGILGPNLNELPKKLAEKKFTPKDVLREILHPSEVINENYKTYQIITTKGEVVTGVIVNQDQSAIRILSNPLEKPREIAVKDIEEKIESKISMMPEGLLTTLSKDEILDLLAYIMSGGQPPHQGTDKSHASK
jgi:putative heme-binding domain-containing protein